jgi:hypothetical protein
MLDLNYRAKIVERRISDKFGNEYQVTFLVVLKAGQFFWKVIKAERIDFDDSNKKEKVICLPSCDFDFDFKSEFLDFGVVNSPYLKNIFFTSQMTRAPSF